MRMSPIIPLVLLLFSSASFSEEPSPTIEEPTPTISVQGLTEHELRQIWDQLDLAIQKVTRMEDYLIQATQTQSAIVTASKRVLESEQTTGEACALLLGGSLGVGAGAGAAALAPFFGWTITQGEFLFWGSALFGPQIGMRSFLIPAALLEKSAFSKVHALAPVIELRPDNFKLSLDALGTAHKIPLDCVEERDRRLAAYQAYLDERSECGLLCARNVVFNKVEIERATAELERDAYTHDWYRGITAYFTNRRIQLLQFRKQLGELLRVPDETFRFNIDTSPNGAPTQILRADCLPIDLSPLPNPKADLLMGAMSPVPSEICVDELVVRQKTEGLEVEGRIFGTVPERGRVLYTVPRILFTKAKLPGEQYLVTFSNVLETHPNHSQTQTEIEALLVSEHGKFNIQRTFVAREQRGPAQLAASANYHR